jgi:DUF1016 N-terminal domain
MARKKGADLGRPSLPTDYASLLESLKSRVRQAQTKAMLSVNRELIQLYWDIGRLIVERQEKEGWGKSVLERLADDLQKSLPGIAGFSRSNVFACGRSMWPIDRRKMSHSLCDKRDKRLG